MPIELRQVNTSRELGEFIRFPFQIYKQNPFWLPPILFDEKQFFNPKKNKALRNSDTILFLAKKDGITCGRIMGIISPSYNEITGQKRARFFKFECIDDQETAHLLIEAIEFWALSKGMNEVIGPFGFSDKDPQGLLISGYEMRAVFLAPYNPTYYTRLLENEGYAKEVDLFEYMIPVPDKIPDFYNRIFERVQRNSNLECVTFHSKKELKPYIIPVLELMNETFSEIFGYYQLDREEMEKFASDYMAIVDIDFVKVVTDQGTVVAFLIAIPDVGPGIQKARGRLFPFGFIHILRQMKKTNFLVLMLGGIKPSHQGIGLDVLMGVKMLESAARRGIKHIHSHLELEKNVKVRAEMEKMSGEVFKTYRIYRKGLVIVENLTKHLIYIVFFCISNSLYAQCWEKGETQSGFKINTVYTLDSLVVSNETYCILNHSIALIDSLGVNKQETWLYFVINISSNYNRGDTNQIRIELRQGVEEDLLNYY